MDAQAIKGPRPAVPGDGAFAVASIAAGVALACLLGGGTATSLTAAPGLTTERTLELIRATPWLWSLGGVGLAMVSLADMWTIPGLHRRLSPSGPGLALLATGAALVGDLLGVLGRLAQTAWVPAALSLPPASAGPVAAGLDILDTTLNTAGFVLVSVSFSTFGLLFLRARHRRLGVVAIVAGALTGLGQLPGLTPLFYCANVAFILWYAGLAVGFRRSRPHGGLIEQSAGERS